MGNETCFRIREHDNYDTSHVVHLLLKYNYATRNQTIARSMSAFTHAFSKNKFQSKYILVISIVSCHTAIVSLSLESVKDVSECYSGSVVLYRKQNILVF